MLIPQNPGKILHKHIGQAGMYTELPSYFTHRVLSGFSVRRKCRNCPRERHTSSASCPARPSGLNRTGPTTSTTRNATGNRTLVSSTAKTRIMEPKKQRRGFRDLSLVNRSPRVSSVAVLHMRTIIRFTGAFLSMMVDRCFSSVLLKFRSKLQDLPLPLQLGCRCASFL